MYGWTGKLLRVNLTDRSAKIESSEKYFDYIGGKGMANRIVYEEVPAGTPPTAPENKVVMSVGPNTGSSAPCSGRMTVSTLSPFTKYNAIVDGHVGGDSAIQIKYAGYDAIIIEGASDTPVYINIQDDKVSVEDATALWGKTTTETSKELSAKHGKGVNVMSIGRAGENLLNLSCVITGVAHSCGGGLGKIWGSKKLKAMVIYGTHGVQIAKPDEVQALNEYVMGDLMGANNNHVVPTVAQSWSEYENPRTRWTGHPGLTWGAAIGGPIDTGESPPGQPTLMGYRTQKAVMDHGPVAEQFTVKMVGCASCPVRCFGGVNLPKLEDLVGVPGTHANTCLGNSPYAGLMPYTTVIPDVSAEGDGRIHANIYSAILADDLGLWDNYGELVATLNYFINNDLMQKILTEAEYSEIDWSKREKGDITFIKDILDRVTDPNHSLSTLAQGAYYVDQQYHDVAPDYLHSQALSVWGPLGGKRHHGNECDAQVGLLTNIIYNRDGMCHTIVNITGSGLPFDLQKSIVEETFGEGCLDKPSFYTPMNEAKARFAKFGVMRQVLHDSFTLCNWVWPMTLSPRKERGYKGDLSVEAQYMAAITGDPWTEASLDHAVERCIQLHRAMTVKQIGDPDMRNLHDVVSEFIFEVNPDLKPFEEGTTKLDREDWQLALTMFYREFGWDEKTGAPTRASLEKFGLNDVADDLDALGLLP
ncbi:aldehyde ferredoxin oxidoreductase [Clostridia bacterium]|nr:aldehyde ferredoxin oxidoreductase [Clostridia bacterium]